MRVRLRKGYSQYETDRPYLAYVPYKQVPKPTDVCEDDIKNKRSREIILTNKQNGIQECIEFTLLGGTPFSRREGYQRYYGKVIVESGHYSHIIFDFDTNGALEKINISFRGVETAGSKGLAEVVDQARTTKTTGRELKKLFTTKTAL